MQVDVAEKGGVVRSAKTTGAVKRSPPSRPMSYVSRVLGELMGDKVPKIRVRHRLCCAASNTIVTVVYFHFSLSVIFATQNWGKSRGRDLKIDGILIIRKIIFNRFRNIVTSIRFLFFFF